VLTHREGKSRVYTNNYCWSAIFDDCGWQRRYVCSFQCTTHPPPAQRTLPSILYIYRVEIVRNILLRTGTRQETCRRTSKISSTLFFTTHGPRRVLWLRLVSRLIFININRYYMEACRSAEPRKRKHSLEAHVHLSLTPHRYIPVYIDGCIMRDK